MYEVQSLVGRNTEGGGLVSTASTYYGVVFASVEGMTGRHPFCAWLTDPFTCPNTLQVQPGELICSSGYLLERKPWGRPWREVSFSWPLLREKTGKMSAASAIATDAFYTSIPDLSVSMHRC